MSYMIDSHGSIFNSSFIVSERELTTTLFLLRCMEVGISIPDDLLTIGLVMDIWTEKGNVGAEYSYTVPQSDFDRF